MMSVQAVQRVHSGAFESGTAPINAPKQMSAMVNLYRALGSGWQ
jgi:hypothetical protein